MVNKKYLLLAGVCAALATQPAFSQETSGDASWSGRDMTYRGDSYDVLDSNYVPKSRMDQHRRFLNHQYAFPAKPRSMWEVGVGLGLYTVTGDVPTLMPWADNFSGSYGFHAHVRKSWGYLFSTRLQYIYGIARGQGWQEDRNYKYNDAWVSAGYQPVNHIPLTQATVAQSEPVFWNYRMESHQLNLDIMLSTNNIRFHKARTGMSLYALFGLGAIAYNTRVDALNENYERYDFYQITGGPQVLPQVNENRKEIQDKLLAAQDGTFETDAENERDKRRPAIFNNKTLNFAPSIGGGMQFRVSKRVNISVEDRLTLPNDEDLLDGQRWAAQVPGEPVFSNNNDVINYLSLGLNINLGNKTKNVEPLYWLNPLDHMYNELSYPRHMILPDPILPDADGDGITDQFDKCPGTAAGVAVDSHGCPLDTDGDGVPDDRDKQLITPTECQPVDADGVGKCPCPDDCGTMAPACGSISAGSIMFSGSSSRISSGAQGQLSSLAAQMNANPTCKVVITGAGNESKIQQQRSWDRVNAIIEYMSETHGIDRNRFIFQYGQAGDPNSVLYRAALPGEEGPANVAPPFPNLRK